MEAEATSLETQIPPDMAGWRLDRALAVLIPTLSRERIKALISSGQVSTDSSPRRRPRPMSDTGAHSQTDPGLRRDDARCLARDPAAKAQEGARYTIIVPAPTTPHNEAQDIPLSIVFEDDHLLVVDKPAGLVVHPAAGNLDGTLVNALLHHCAGRLSGIGGVARPGIVHRIDKDTSGLLVVAKTDPAHEGLSAQFMKHSINRRYVAVIAGIPKSPSGTVDAPLARSSHDRKKIAIVRDGQGKRAITHWTLTEALKRAALIECRLETGRTHQIRVHMASLGHPLLGDPVYGSGRPEHRETLRKLDFKRQALHAAELGFLHPISGTPLNFKSEVPCDIQQLLSALRI